MRVRTGTFVALALAALLAACAGPVQPMSGGQRSMQPPSAASAPGLEGAPWTVTGYAAGAGAWAVPLAQTRLTLAFERGALRGSAGCNAFRGTYATEDGRLAIELLATTRKACRTPGVMQQERDFLAALQAAARWSVDGGTIVLAGADGRRLVHAARPPR